MAARVAPDGEAAEAAMNETALLAAEHRDMGHPAYFSDCPECAADSDAPGASTAPGEVEQGDATLPAVVPKTPYERLVGMLVAPTRCAHCGRADTMTPATVAARVGLSESSVRRLMLPDVPPSMRVVTAMANHLGVSAVALLGELWPDLARP